MRYCQKAISGRCLVALHPCPQILGVGAIVLRKWDDCIGSLLSAPEYDEEALDDLEWKGATEGFRELCEKLGSNSLLDQATRWQEE